MEDALIIEIRELLYQIKNMLKNRLARLGWISLQEAVQYSGLSESTIRRSVRMGSLKRSTRPGKMMFKINEIERWLNEK